MESLIGILVLLSLFVGALGSSRLIGFWPAFFWSLFLSPLIGIIITLASPHLMTIQHLNKVNKSNDDKIIVNENVETNTSKLTNDLKQLQDLKDKNIISDKEFNRLKSYLISTHIND